MPFASCTRSCKRIRSSNASATWLLIVSSSRLSRPEPFRYAMNCATLLALSFMDKGEAKIASLWYEKALHTPGIDQETILALRYDLGVALATAGESPAALDSFRQVYAMNIDYLDVADRIAVLQKV